MISESTKWQGIRTIIEVERERIIKGKASVEKETQYSISSLGVDPKFIAHAIRGNWEVENRVHWVLDLTYKEDASGIRRENAVENIAIARRFALNLARLYPKKDSMRGKLKQAMWCDNFRHEIVFGQN